MKIQFRKQPAVARGFTIVEVLTVIAILAILGGIGFGTFMLINKNSKISQAEVMVKNVATQLEIIVNEGLTKQDISDLGNLVDADTQMPVPGTGDQATEGIYALLSGDYDLDGEIDDGRSPVIAEIAPNYTGKGSYLPRLEPGSSREITELYIVDPWGQPMRYNYNPDGTGLNNNAEGGFDLWSLGPDGKDAGELNDDGDDGGLDNINSW